MGAERPRAIPAYPPKLDPRRPRAGEPNPLWSQIAAAVDQFGRSETRTRSRRHGHEPQARGHVEAYLEHRVLGLSVRTIARARQRSVSTTHQSIRRGKRLVHHGAEARGFSDPDGGHLVMDYTEPEGWSQERK